MVGLGEVLATSGVIRPRPIIPQSASYQALTNTYKPVPISVQPKAFPAMNRIDETPDPPSGVKFSYWVARHWGLVIIYSDNDCLPRRAIPQTTDPAEPIRPQLRLESHNPTAFAEGRRLRRPEFVGVGTYVAPGWCCPNGCGNTGAVMQWQGPKSTGGPPTGCAVLPGNPAPFRYPPALIPGGLNTHLFPTQSVPQIVADPPCSSGVIPGLSFLQGSFPEVLRSASWDDGWPGSDTQSATEPGQINDVVSGEAQGTTSPAVTNSRGVGAVEIPEISFYGAIEEHCLHQHQHGLTTTFGLDENPSAATNIEEPILSIPAFLHRQGVSATDGDAFFKGRKAVETKTRTSPADSFHSRVHSGVAEGDILPVPEHISSSESTIRVGADPPAALDEVGLAARRVIPAAANRPQAIGKASDDKDQSPDRHESNNIATEKSSPHLSRIADQLSDAETFYAVVEPLSHGTPDTQNSPSTSKKLHREYAPTDIRTCELPHRGTRRMGARSTREV